jgi:hypothetical protein
MRTVNGVEGALKTGVKEPGFATFSPNKKHTAGVLKSS